VDLRRASVLLTRPVDDLGSPGGVVLCGWGKRATEIGSHDTTLRDGCQGAGISFALQDTLDIARRLDEFGVEELLVLRAGIRSATFDCARGQGLALPRAGVLRTSPDENFAMIGDAVVVLEAHGREVIVDAGLFFRRALREPRVRPRRGSAPPSVPAPTGSSGATRTGAPLPPQITAGATEVGRRSSVGLRTTPRSPSGDSYPNGVDFARARRNARGDPGEARGSPGTTYATSRA
jgi:hypothetical protein